MKVVKGEDGREYLEWEGQVAVPYAAPLWSMSTDQSGSAVNYITVNTANTSAYTIDDLFAMRNKTWARWPEALLPGDIPEGFQSIGTISDDGIEFASDTGELDALRDQRLAAGREYLSTIGRDLSITVNRWLPGDDEGCDVRASHRTGRFQNLDWDEAS